MLRFYPYQLDTLNHCLWRERLPGKSESVGLPPKTFDVLRLLVESGGRLVSHDELLDALWPGGDVQPEVLKGHILAIRAALGDDAQHPKFIETQRGRGYRFIASIDNRANDALDQGATTKRFVGREPELAALHRFFEAARRREPRMVFISGEPGIGKTTLIDQFISQVAHGLQLRIGIGRSVESHGTSEPYFPVFEALAALIRSDAHDETINTLLSRAPSWALQLPGVVPAERWLALHRQSGGMPRNRLVGEFCDFIEALTEDWTLLLVLEDLHWADFSTIDLLKALVNRRHNSKFLIVCTYRKEIANFYEHPVGKFVQNLLPYDACAELCLPPLSGSEVSDLLGTTKTHEQATFAEFVSRQAGGNPLFVSLIVDQLVQRKLVEMRDTGWELALPVEDMVFDAPVTLADVVELQVRQLNPDQQTLLECASIFGDGFNAASVAALVEQDESAVERALEVLGRSSMFIGRGDIEYPEEGLPFRRYLFKHAVYRSAFYDRQAPTQRARRHLAAAHVLTQAQGDPIGRALELARHFEAAAAWAQALEQLRLLLVVAKKRFARRDALTVIERADAIIQRYRSDARDKLTLFWMEEKAEIEAASHDYSARTTYESLVQKASALGLVEEWVRALLGLAVVNSWLDVDSCLATLGQALQVSAMQDDPFQRTRTAVSCHVWKIWVGGWDRDAARSCDESIAIVKTAQDQVGAAWSLVEYSMLCLLSSRYREAQETIISNFGILQRSTPGQAERGSARAAWMVSLGMPWSDMLQGKLGMALERLGVNIDMLDKNAGPSAANMLRLLRAQLFIHALDFEGAHEECDAVMRSIEERLRTPDQGRIAALPGERRICEITLGVALVGLGNLPAGIERLLQVERELLTQPISFDWYRSLFLEWGLVRAYVRHGDLVNAKARSARLLEQAVRTDEQCWQALAWEMAMHVALLGNDADAARRAMTRAIDIVSSTQVPLAAWRVYQTAAAVHLGEDNVEVAQQYIASARDARQGLIASLPPAHRLCATLGSVQPTARLE